MGRQLGADHRRVRMDLGPDMAADQPDDPLDLPGLQPDTSVAAARAERIDPQEADAIYATGDAMAAQAMLRQAEDRLARLRESRRVLMLSGELSWSEDENDG